MNYPDRTCKVEIELRKGFPKTIIGFYDPNWGFLTYDKRVIWNENVLAFKILERYF